MTIIFAIIGLMLAGDLLWWVVARRLASRMRPSSVWRMLVAVFAGAQIAGLLCIVGSRIARDGLDRLMPKVVSSVIIIWHFLGVPTVILAVLLGAVVCAARALVRHSHAGPGQAASTPPDGQACSRRQFISALAVAAPPLCTLGLTGIAMAQLNRFRVRRFVLPIAGLPHDLDGLTIAHLSDLHVGRFTAGRVLREIARATNELKPDLILFTGDLINDALADLADGLALVRALDARHGICMIEGNHDLIENSIEFERRAKASGIPFLVNESLLLHIRGCDVQLLGLPWGKDHWGPRDRAMAVSVNTLLRQRQPGAFPILLAHHPHAFDAAAVGGIPLTLSGHTHGGQLMLSERLGCGPALFRYWSGTYLQNRAHLVVSNGVGNWFPLRVNAPAEIIHLTLRKV